MKNTESGESSDEKVEPGGAEMKDPMSGYASADAIVSETDVGGAEAEHADELKDPMSGYASADALAKGASAGQDSADKIHTEEVKDSMSGYASADALAPGEE
ncbi:MAG: hypothetical protein M3362_14795 [Acidobacteriota bacterium]|nr:hypothetical protein [Acidobacteriota bacterium]